MKQTTQKISNPQPGKKIRVALIVSQFNSDICEGLLKGALEVLGELGCAEDSVDVYHVPGAFEIPLMAKKCAVSKKYQGVVCLGAVIRGETPHFDFISQAVSQGIQQVALETGFPMGFGVITTNTLEQAVARSGANEYNKGKEATVAVVEMIEKLI